MKNIIFSLIVGSIVISSLVAISQIGKERKPIEAGSVVISIIVSALMIYGIYYLTFGG